MKPISDSFPSLLSKPLWVASSDDLNCLAGKLTKEKVIAVDTESNSLHAYQERVCLIQISTPVADYLIDPLALGSEAISRTLGPLFKRSDIVKVFHAAEYDLIMLRRDFNIQLSNLFDTMWAARVCGWKELGLGTILKQKYGIEVNKHHQRANWGRRPLPAELLEYARMDTHYLIPLRECLQDELKRCGRLALAEEDFEYFCQEGRLKNGNNHQRNMWQISGVEALSPRQLAVLNELWLMRERLAHERDCPVFKILSDRDLLNLAEGCPQSPQMMRRLPLIAPRQAERYEKAILAAVQRGLTAEPPQPPPKPLRPDQTFLDRLEALQEWRKQMGRRWKVESDVILPRTIMFELARQSPPDAKAINQVLAPFPWRRAHFSEEIMTLLNAV